MLVLSHQDDGMHRPSPGRFEHDLRRLCCELLDSYLTRERLRVFKVKILRWAAEKEGRRQQWKEGR